MTNTDTPTRTVAVQVDQLAYSPADAAKLLGCGRTFLYELMNRGELRSVKLGGRRLIPRSAIVELLEAQDGP